MGGFMGEDEVVRRWLVGPPGVSAPVGISPVDSQGVDAFARVRTSEPHTLFDSQLEYDAQPLVWDTSTTGTASVVHDPERAGVVLTVGSSGVAIRQSHGYMRYQPGKSQLIDATFLAQPVVGFCQRIGYFDGDNGLYFEVSGTVAHVVRRYGYSGTFTEERVPQEEWNVDRLDQNQVEGRGDRYNPSNIRLDLSRTQHLVIDSQWLGVGRARVGFFYKGVIHTVHEFNSANYGERPILRTANLPVRYEARGGPNAIGQASLLQICASVISEGGFEEERGFPFSASNGITGTVSVSLTTLQPILSVRPKATFGGQINRVVMFPDSLEVWAKEKPVYWELRHGGVIATAAWQSVDANSAFQFDTIATSCVGGQIVRRGYAGVKDATAGGQGASASSDVFLSRLRLALGIFGEHPATFPTDVLTILAAQVGEGTTPVGATVHWREFR
jgi:hypothetical protein